MRQHVLQLIVMSAFGLFAQDDPVWSPAARMTTPRVDHCAAPLADGRLLIAGGSGQSGTLASVEIYGPEDAYQPGPEMKYARSAHRCTVLSDGRVFVSGGSPESGAEIFDPATNQWSELDSDGWKAARHTATPLPGDRVLLAGGTSTNGPSTALAIFDAAANAIRLLPASLIWARVAPIAAPLPDGSVLLAGGLGSFNVVAESEIFDPATETSRPAASMNLARVFHGAALLPGGGVLVIGGSDGALDLGNAEIYNPADDRWEWVAAPMVTPRSNSLVLTLPSGNVLIAGGQLDGIPTGATELFDPETREFRSVGGLTAPRSAIAGALLPQSGFVLATGGLGTTGPSDLCGTLRLPSLDLLNGKGTAPVDSFSDADEINAGGASFADSPNVSFSVTRADGVAVDTSRLRTTSVQPVLGRFQVPVFVVAAKAGDIGKTFLVTARQGLTTRATASFTPRATSLLRIVSAPSATRLGVPASYTFALSTDIDAGPLNGTLTVKTGTVSRSIQLVNQPRSGSVTVDVCCPATAGTYSVSINYSGDTNYRPAAAPGPGLTVTRGDLSLNVSVGGGFPLFTQKTATFQLVPSPNATVSPTGSVTISRSGGGFTQTVPLTSASGAFSYKATFEDRLGVCFFFQYPGDANFAPITLQACRQVILATPVISATPSPSFIPDRFFPLQASITFPPELGLVTRFLNITALGADGSRAFLGTLSFQTVAVGQASGQNAVLRLPFPTAQLRVDFPGGGDLAPAIIIFPMQRSLIPAPMSLFKIVTDSSPILTLTCTFRPIRDGAPAATAPLPTGTMRFFDGTFIIGSVSVVGTADSPPSSTVFDSYSPSFVYNSPVGTRTLRCEYSGDPNYEASRGPEVNVVVR